MRGNERRTWDQLQNKKWLQRQVNNARISNNWNRRWYSMSIRNPTPRHYFQIQGLEIVLQDEERKQEMVEMKASEKHGKKLDFSTQKIHLKSMEQLINIISPSNKQNSFLPNGFNGIEIIALIRVFILLFIRCGECCWLKRGNN